MYLVNDYSPIAKLYIFVYERTELSSISLECKKVKFSILNNFENNWNILTLILEGWNNYSNVRYVHMWRNFSKYFHSNSVRWKRSLFEGSIFKWKWRCFKVTQKFHNGQINTICIFNTFITKKNGWKPVSLLFSSFLLPSFLEEENQKIFLCTFFVCL